MNFLFIDFLLTIDFRITKRDPSRSLFVFFLFQFLNYEKSVKVRQNLVICIDN